MSGELRELEPGPVWTRFLELTRIPRPPRGEEQVRAHVLAWAQARAYHAASDDAGNVVVRVPASSGRERAPTIVLQAHLDMVCERDPDSPYDPRAGRIHVVRDGDWLVAEGTTLGADNGIGVASAMAVAEDPAVVHGPLELLFTVCEEEGLEGAKALDASLVEGRLLVNLDGTSDGAITVGCAGSAHTFVRVPLAPEPLGENERELLLELSGARGGHSGGDIHRGRANAIKALGRVLHRARSVAPFRLVSLEGGVSRNAIPREAGAIIVLPAEAEHELRAATDDELTRICAEYAGTDDRLTIEVESGDRQATDCYLAGAAPGNGGEEVTRRVLELLAALPTGVVAFAEGLEDVVETSTSLNVARTEDGVLMLSSMTRSSDAARLEQTVTEIEETARRRGAGVETRRSYPPWSPDPDSGLLTTARESYRRLFSTEPRLEIVHGGLECAVIGAKLPGVEMISLGPTVLGPHAPGERLGISSTARFYGLLVALLDELSG